MALIGLGLAACEQEETAIEGLDAESPQQILWDFSTSESDSGQLKWVLTGRKALFFESQPQVRASDVHLQVFDDEGRESSLLEADSAFLDKRGGQGDMTARGNVYVISSDSTELWSSELVWSENDQVFRSDSFVEVREGRDLHSGYKVTCDENLGRLWIDSLPRHEIISEEGILP
jgi:LPS export ABC transporter protein LptC